VNLRPGPRSLLAALALVCCGALAAPLDPFATEARVAPGASRAIDDETTENPCTFAAVPTPLELPEAIERALCQNPQTRAAWGEARTQAALLGVARSAYLPSMAASVRAVPTTVSTRYLMQKPGRAPAPAA